MEVLFVIVLVWAFVILVGHGSYVLLHALFRATFGGQRRSDPQPSIEADISAARRVIGRLVGRDWLSPQETAKLRRCLDDLQAAPESEPTAAPPLPDRIHPPTQSAGPAVNEALTPGLESAAQPILAELVADELVAEDETEPAAPALSKAEIIRSFLAVRNIRWGELVAGLLIVVCSIGLVISLWNTIIEHRIVPSMIFLGANAAIYAAGFYTLSRWRLRHTSRAVLVIATLLVPLTVLAGIAAAGTGSSALQLTDPVTLLTIVIAGTVYVGLLYRGGNALARRPYALPVCLAVAGPAATLPLIPAAIRVLTANAGWVVGIGSIAVLVALSLIVRMRGKAASSLGTMAGRARLTVMALAAFAMSVTVGYTAFAMRGVEGRPMLAIAIATIPAIIALAASAGSLASDARRSYQAMAGAVLGALLMGLTWVMLPPATASVGWLWSWAIVLSASAAAATWLFRESRWLAVSTLPIGIATTLSSPVWMGGQVWSEVGFWNRCIAGEPMLAAAMTAVAVGLLGCAIPLIPPVRQGDATSGTMRRWLLWSALLWSGVALSIAAVLSVMPQPWLGVAPWWSVTAVLLTGALISAALVNRHHWFAIATVVTTTIAAVSVFRPLQWNVTFTIAPPVVWIQTTIAVATGLLIWSELLTRIKKSDSSHESTAHRGRDLWNVSACLAASLAVAIACSLAATDWNTSAATLACASGLLLWSTTLSRSMTPLVLCQLSTVGLATVIGYGQYHQWLFTGRAWETGIAPFAWAITGAVVLSVWLGIRQLAAALDVSPIGRLQFLRRESQVIQQLPSGWAALVATALVAIGSAWSFASLLSGAFGTDAVIYDVNWRIPVTAFASLGTMIAWMRWQEPRSIDSTHQDFPDSLATVVTVGFITWIASQVATLLTVDPQVQLVIATSLASAAYLYRSRDPVWLALAR